MAAGPPGNEPPGTWSFGPTLQTSKMIFSFATDGGFPETRWTRVLAIRSGAGSSEDSDKALAELCEAYWLPIYSYARHRGETPHEAEDSTQEFFGMLLSRELFNKAEPDRGKLRTFLIGAFKLFQSERKRGAQRLKRGGRQRFVSLDETIGEDFLRETATSSAEPEIQFDRFWAQTVLRRALRRLEDEYYRRGQLQVFDRLRGQLGLDTQPEDLTALTQALEMSPGAVRVAIHRLRQTFRRLLEEEVAHTLSVPMDLREEIRYLARILPPGMPTSW